MAAHSSILAWRGPWTEEPGGLQSRGRKELDATKRLTLHCYCYYVEKEMATHSGILAWRIPWTDEPNGHGVAKSQTRLSD